MKTSRPNPLAPLSLATLLLAGLVAGLFVVQNSQNSDLGVSSVSEGQLARVGIEGEELPVPFVG